MPPEQPRGSLSVPHDWHSEGYVTDWIAHDLARDPVRRPRLREMLAAAPFARDARLAVLDVGAGYGAVTEGLLQVFPAAEITLQDYSEPMLGEASGCETTLVTLIDRLGTKHSSGGSSKDISLLKKC